MNQYSRVYAGKNKPVQGQSFNLNGIFDRRSKLQKVGRDNPELLILGGAIVGAAAMYLLKKKK